MKPLLLAFVFLVALSLTTAQSQILFQVDTVVVFSYSQLIVVVVESTSKRMMMHRRVLTGSHGGNKGAGTTF